MAGDWGAAVDVPCGGYPEMASGRGRVYTLGRVVPSPLASGRVEIARRTVFGACPCALDVPDWLGTTLHVNMTVSVSMPLTDRFLMRTSPPAPDLCTRCVRTSKDAVGMLKSRRKVDIVFTLTCESRADVAFTAESFRESLRCDQIRFP